MGVNWQNNPYYKALKDYEKESGTTLAERNAIANPNGSHSKLGVIGTSLFLGLANFGLNELGNSSNGSQDTGSETDIDNSKKALSNLGKTLRNFDKAIASQNTADIDKYLKELKELAPSSANAQKAYDNAVKKRKNYIQQKSSN